MGQKVHPIGFRVGITEGWRSRWFAPKAAYAEFLIEDQVIRRFVDERLNRQPPFAGLARVEIGDSTFRPRTDGGPYFRRWRPKDRGRVHPIAKRTSHIVVTVAEG